ncbi:MAG: tRNA (adenosine(37)-N6)-dimethylallyltransferase MiaA [Pseudomonadota bacterium]
MSDNLLTYIADISKDMPILLAGPTASGKSAAALAWARSQGRAIVNADALQVYGCWRVLSARPDPADEARALHHLYGHVGAAEAYSVGHWLREVEPLLELRPAPILVGGTGLYFRALTEGLAEIPATPPAVRAEADARLRAEGHSALLAELDAATAAGIDTMNPMRVQRAWEVARATGRPLSDWQSDTPPPLLPLSRSTPFVIHADKIWLNARIEQRFDAMMAQGALDEARAMEPGWTPSAPAAKAIGAAELIAYIRGEITLDQARERAIIATRRYAKRQRTWFRARMKGWASISMPR